MITTNSELTAKGWKALVERLGVTEATLFLLQYQRGTGDYTKYRRDYFRNMTLDNIVADIERADDDLTGQDNK